MSEEITNTDTAALNTEAAYIENNAYDSTELYTEPTDTSEVVDDTQPVDTKESEDDGQKPDGEDADTTQTNEDQSTNPDLERRLREYELHKEEQALLRQRLGLNDNISDEEVSFANMDRSIVNRGQTAYLDLCNRYGVDADLNKLDQTIETLKQTDPAKGYKFEAEVDRLATAVSNQRNEISNYRYTSGIQQFERDNAQILSASPVLQQTLSQVVQANAGDPNIYSILNNTMSYIQAIYSEAFNYGKQYSVMDNAKRDTSKVEGSITNGINQTTVNAGQPLTTAQIRNMSQAEFEKNYESIMRAYAEGRIVD